MTPVIAIDGPTASGKGTLARKLAAHYNYDWLDTGLLYRAVALAMQEQGLDPASAAVASGIAADLGAHDLEITLADPRLRLESTGTAASQVAGHADVRKALLDLQREFAVHPPGGNGAVLDGRDIGTVICPHADAKLFVIADVEIRATRRLKELQGREIKAIYASVLEDLMERDARDSQRVVAPLKPAADALLLDVSSLDVEQAFAAALRLVQPFIGRPASR